MLDERLGKYQIIEQLGEGASAVVYKAKHTHLEKIVALKVFNKDEQSESLSLQALEHPHIVQVFDFDEEDGIQYLVMEYIERQTFEQYIKEERERKGSDLLYEIGLVLELSEAVDFAHQKGILHRDIKSSNTFITEQGAKLSDFGLAKTLDFESSMITEKEIAGTPKYMAPEAEKGNYSELSDIFSLGIVLCEMTTGERPAMGTEIDNEDLERVILKAINQKPVKRYHSVGEFIEDLKEIKKSLEKELDEGNKLATQIYLCLKRYMSYEEREKIGQDTITSVAEEIIVPILEEQEILEVNPKEVAKKTIAHLRKYYKKQ